MLSTFAVLPVTLGFLAVYAKKCVLDTFVAEKGTQAMCVSLMHVSVK